jgi:hypothetical protein
MKKFITVNELVEKLKKYPECGEYSITIEYNNGSSDPIMDVTVIFSDYNKDVILKVNGLLK